MWRRASGDTQPARSSTNEPPHAVVYGASNGPVVVQEMIGHLSQTVRCFGWLELEGFTADVPGGGHNRSANGSDERTMQRAWRQKYPEIGHVGCHGFCDDAGVASRQKHNGARWASKGRCSLRG